MCADALPSLLFPLSLTQTQHADTQTHTQTDTDTDTPPSSLEDTCSHAASISSFVALAGLPHEGRDVLKVVSACHAHDRVDGHLHLHPEPQGR